MLRWSVTDSCKFRTDQWFSLQLPNTQYRDCHSVLQTCQKIAFNFFVENCLHLAVSNLSIYSRLEPFFPLSSRQLKNYFNTYKTAVVVPAAGTVSFCPPESALWMNTRTEIPSQLIDGHRSPVGPIDGHNWSIDEVFLTSIDDPSMGIEIFGHKNSFDLAMFKTSTTSTKLSPFKFFSLFKLCLGFRECPNILFGSEVIHSCPY